jgi:hypothetical protein
MILDGDHDRAAGCIHVCPNGCVCLKFGSTSVHLPPAEFRGFLRAILKTAEELGLLQRTGDPTLGEPARGHHN